MSRLHKIFICVALSYPVGCRTTDANENALLDETDGPTAPEAQNIAAPARFAAWTEEMRPSLGTGLTGQAAADALLQAAGARISTFNLQALGRLYEQFDPYFKDLRKDFKELEDRLGAYDKWSSILAKAEQNGASAQTIADLKQKRLDAHTKLVTTLVDRKWAPVDGSTPRFDAMQSWLDTHTWPPYLEEKAILMERLAGALRTIDGTTFDMSRLEEGNGLHELRRQVRWFAIEARVLNGLITFRPDNADCPVAAFAPLVDLPIASSKYSKLPLAATETSPCLISRCLFLGLVDFINELGQLKDKAEVIVNTTQPEDPDQVPPTIRTKAEQLETQLRASGGLLALADQIDQCHQ